MGGRRVTMSLTMEAADDKGSLVALAERAWTGKDSLHWFGCAGYVFIVLARQRADVCPYVAMASLLLA